MNCKQVYEGYLCDVPSKWREQIASLLCKAVQDITSAAEGCDKVKNCETVTSLGVLELDGQTLSIPYTDERGVTTKRQISLAPLSEGDFIENQFSVPQTADFWISGKASVGNINVTDSTIPSNGIYLSSTNEISFSTNGAQVTKIDSSALMNHTGNIRLSGATTPGISFFSGSFANSDYFIRRNGTSLVYASAGIGIFQIGGSTAYRFQANSDRGHQWYDMNGVSPTLLAQLFPDGTFEIGTSLPVTSSPCALIRMNSTTKGLVLPNMTTAQKNAISTPLPGLMVFDTDLMKICVYTNIWETITSS